MNFGSVEDLTLGNLQFKYRKRASILRPRPLRVNLSIKDGGFCLITPRDHALLISEKLDDSYLEIDQGTVNPSVILPSGSRIIRDIAHHERSWIQNKWFPSRSLQYHLFKTFTGEPEKFLQKVQTTNSQACR